MKHILILLSLLILTSPLVAQETGVLYFKKVNGKYGWFENGNDKKDWKYIGEIKNGKPNGTGVLSSTLGKYSGELKNGMKHGQGTYTYKSGRKRVGEFRKSKPWNVNNYDKNGKIEAAWVKGIKLKWVKGIKLKKEEASLEEKEHTENKSYKIGVRVLFTDVTAFLKVLFNPPEYFPKVELNTPVPFGFPFLISPIYFQSFLSLPF